MQNTDFSPSALTAPPEFRTPGAHFRGAPFWAWNGTLNAEELLRQIDIFEKMGFGGFHMHVRTGLDTPYLGKDFFEAVRLCIRRAEKDGLLARLYDEDRWPSGTAGGEVTREHPEYARKTLLMTVTPYAPERPHRALGPEPGRGQESIRQDNGELLAIYDIVLNSDGTLAQAARITEDTPVQGTRWYAYCETATADPWFNNAAYADTLEPAAMQRFIELTHEVYAKEVGEEFGGTVPSMFTDEPQFAPHSTLAYATGTNDVFLPWTAALPELYRRRFGTELLDDLPQLLWELPEGRLSRVRWQFHDLVCQRFVDSYCRTLGEWCTGHNLQLTGHVMGEPTLAEQTAAVGDAMRCYRWFGLPGIDMLCGWHEYNTAKQTQSMVHQLGKPGMLSELYGVTGWDFDFRGHKLQGDWQAALGVTVRVPHLSWMTMKGEAKRDYPASISYQSPWWDQYALIEDHFARLNTALTDGKPRVRLAVVHPVESFWLLWGPAEQTARARAAAEQRFARVAETLLFGTLDFNYLCEAELPELVQAAQASAEGVAPGQLGVGEMRYDAVLVCGCRTLRRSTLDILQAYADRGGKLIFAGDCPDYIDALPDDSARALYSRCLQVSDEPDALLPVLENLREVDIRRPDGTRTEDLLYQMRSTETGRWLFLAHGKDPVTPDADSAETLRIRLKGVWELTEWDTLTGEVRPLSAEIQNGFTVFERRWYQHDSLLLKLAPLQKPAAFAAHSAGNAMARPADTTALAPALCLAPVPYALSEPNALLLDLAEFSLNDGPFQPEDEVLRIDNRARQELGLPLRRKEVVQPYLLQPETPADTLTLRFTFDSEIDGVCPHLALEDVQQAVLNWNGAPITAQPDGWYVDRCLETVPLPPLQKGQNVLTVRLPLGRRTNAEALYLLGSFGVHLVGTRRTLTPLPTLLGFGDFTAQGLPFYTGNVDYTLELDTQPEVPVTVRVPRWRGALVRVLCDGVDAGPIAFSPYTLTLPLLQPGRHCVTIRLYGTRQNGFGQLHHTPGIWFYQSPNSWRSAGDLWSYEYQLRPAGILKSPEIFGAAVVQSDGVVRTGVQTSHVTDRS